ncbi:MAG: tetratricopeptide repeat protein [Lachnospiraceae bacterium]|nr:tetratricopeptide repeat protein [Lachnospiraceae bacterium]
MICYNCGASAGDLSKCPACGTDLRAYRMFVGISDVLYNRAVYQARENDISDAINTLVLALKYNKININARNLLGLLHYRRGEETEAVKQWLISRGFQPEDNMANHFLEETDSDTRERVRLSSVAQNFNQVITHLNTGAYDLAALQVKKVVGICPNHVQARQIQGLLFLREGKYDRAIKTLTYASRVDNSDSRTQLYIREARSRKNREKNKTDAYEVKSGDQTIIQPKHTRTQGIINMIMNFVIGILIGAGLVWFIIVPSVRKSLAANANEQLLQANDTISTRNQQITQLEDEISDLTDQLKSSKSKNEDTDRLKATYDALAGAYKAYAEGDYETATVIVQSVEPDLLSVSGNDALDYLSENVVNTYLQEVYDEANYYYEGQNIYEATKRYDTIVALAEDYDNGNALYNLAQCYRKSHDYTTAIKYYTRVSKLFDGTEIGDSSLIYISQLQNYQ